MQWYDADTLLSLLLPQNVTAVFAFYRNIASDLTDDARVCELHCVPKNKLDHQTHGGNFVKS